MPTRRTGPIGAAEFSPAGGLFGFQKKNAGRLRHGPIAGVRIGVAKSTIKPWHLLAAMFGAPALLLGLVGQPHGVVIGVGLPVAGALLVGWLLIQVMPKPVVVAMIGGVAALQAVRTQRLADREEAERGEERRARVMVEICDGNAVDLAAGPNAKLRVLYKRQVDQHEPVWLDDSTWDAKLVPELILCVTETTEEVSSGMYTDPERPDAAPVEISTSRYLEDVELRRVPSAEIVFTKRYFGGDPPPLPTEVQFGGAQHTVLSGSRVGYETFYADIKPFL